MISDLISRVNVSIVDDINAMNARPMFSGGSRCINREIVRRGGLILFCDYVVGCFLCLLSGD